MAPAQSNGEAVTETYIRYQFFSHAYQDIFADIDHSQNRSFSCYPGISGVI